MSGTGKHRLTRAIHHIRLAEVNSGKLAALDALWVAYKTLCEHYLTYFCTEATPDGLADTCFESDLSARWQRVAMQQVAGIAQSWRSNRTNRLRAFEERLTWYEWLPEVDRQARQKPEWHEPQIPELHAVSIQASVNVAEQVSPDDQRVMKLEKSEDTAFDFWLKVSTLDKRHPVYVPVRLGKYHRKALAGHTPNESVTLARRDGWWWLTLSVTEEAPEGKPISSAVGLDVGIINYVTDSSGARYGGVGTGFMAQVERVRAKTARKAKLRACLAKNGVPKDKPPSTTSAQSQRLSRRIRQDIERAVVECLDAHPHQTLVVEALVVGTMRFKAKRMNSYLKASQLAHIHDHLYWTAAKRGIPVVAVNPAYSSQACPRCHYADRANRPSQQTFCCVKCGQAGQADTVAAGNLEARLTDTELWQCRGKDGVKALLDRRYAAWLATQSPG